MSVSPIARQVTQMKNIPTKRMMITDNTQLPHDYSSTPGGTLYSTTPGGTRIIYERSFLMNLRNSPMSKTPPKTGTIPDFLLKGASQNRNTISPPRCVHTIDEEQFVMEI